MRRKSTLKPIPSSLLVAGALALLPSATWAATAPTTLLERFKNPPGEARSTAYWAWLDSNVSKEGITADLEAMKEQGMGGALQMVLEQRIAPGSVVCDTSEYWEMVAHAIKEGARLGLEIGFHNGPGWSSSGGPWVKPEDAMKRFTWTEAHVRGGSKIKVTLPQPSPDRPFYRDIAVLAVPETAAEADLIVSANPELTSGGNPLDQTALLDGDWKTVVRFKKGEALLAFKQPVTACALALASVKGERMTAGIDISDDGAAFRAAGSVQFTSDGCSLISCGGGNFAPATGRFWRITLRPEKGEPADFPVGWLSLRGRPLAPDFDVHAAYRADKGVPAVAATNAFCTTGRYPAPSEIINLSGKMKPDGSLEWDAPAGEWTILRLGYASTERDNRPAPEGGRGLEVDKFDKAALGRFFATYPAKWAALAAQTPDAKQLMCEVDSYEVGSQNWSACVPDAFQNRHGYDITPWLPAFTGRIVGSAADTDRFFRDMRITFIRLMADHYYGELRRLCNASGMRLVIEPGGTGNFSGRENGYAADEAWPEFWTRPGCDKSPTGLSDAMIAHTLGRTEVVAAEAFTSEPMADAWSLHPRSLKPYADLAFAGGINRMVYHTSAHQAVEGTQITYGRWGVNFNRNNTWWPLSRPFHDYVARCGGMLQAGKSVADLLILADEASPDAKSGTVGAFNGYAADHCGPSRLFVDGVRVENGALVLASGTRYRLLAISSSNRRVSPELAEKIAELVEAGMPVIGQPFEGAAGLAGGEGAETRVEAAVKRIWQSGHKHVFAAGTPGEVLAKLGVPPNFQMVGANPPRVFPMRRQVGTESLYFLCSAEDKPVKFSARFGCVAPAVELWNPVTLERQTALCRSVADGRTEVDLALPERGAVFVMFLNAHADSTISNLKFEISNLLTLPGPWKVSFPPKLGAPEKIDLTSLTDLSDHSDPGVKYFSGVATYSTAFEISGVSPQTSIKFEKVEVIAEVLLNGRSLGHVWAPPYRISCGDALKAGRNELTVRVANNWVNRMIGDEQLPEDAVYTKDPWPLLTDKNRGWMLKEWPEWLKKGEPRSSGRISLPTYKYWTKNDPLLPSGLIGQVTIETSDVK